MHSTFVDSRLQMFYFCFFLRDVFSAATGHWKNIWSLGPKNILYFNCLNLGRSCWKKSVDGHVWLWVLRMPVFSPKRDTMQNSATSPSLTCLLDRYPLWIGYNRIEQIGLHTMFMRFTCTAQNRRKPCKTIMQPRVWWPLYGHCHLTWRSQDWEYCCLPPPSATEGQLALSVQVDLASSSRIYLMFDEAPSVWRKIERCHFPCMSLRVVFFFSLFLSPLCFICCSWFSVTRKFYLFGTT